MDKLYYVDTPFWTVDTIFYTVIDTKVVEPKYIYYVLQKEHLEKLNKAGGVPSLTQAVVSKVKIPVPPLQVQREIVRVLDNFTEQMCIRDRSYRGRDDEKSSRWGPRPLTDGKRVLSAAGSPEGSRPFGKVSPQGRWEFPGKLPYLV